MEENLTVVIKNARAMFENFLAMVPQIIIGLIVFALFFILGKFAHLAIKRIFAHRNNNLAIVLARLLQWIIVMVGAFAAMVFIVPSFKAGDFVTTLGLGSVAIGFAFKDVLQNFLSGLLILLTEPFKVGDQIIVNDKGIEGTITRIETRATLIKTYDGRRVVIPNADLYTGVVTVNTAYDKKRSEYDVGISYEADVDTAKKLILTTVKNIEDVLSHPEPDVLTVDLGDSALKLRIRWWTKSTRASTADAHDTVLEAINRTLALEGIETPYPTSTILLKKIDQAQTKSP